MLNKQKLSQQEVSKRSSKVRKYNPRCSLQLLRSNTYTCINQWDSLGEKKIRKEKFILHFPA